MSDLIQVKKFIKILFSQNRELIRNLKLHVFAIVRTWQKNNYRAYYPKCLQLGSDSHYF